MTKNHISLYRKAGRAKRIIPQLLRSSGFTHSNKIEWGWDGVFLARHAFPAEGGVLPYRRYDGVNITLVKIPVSWGSRKTHNAWAIRPEVTVEEVQNALSFM